MLIFILGHCNYYRTVFLRGILNTARHTFPIRTLLHFTIYLSFQYLWLNSTHDHHTLYYISITHIVSLTLYLFSSLSLSVYINYFITLLTTLFILSTIVMCTDRTIHELPLAIVGHVTRLGQSCS